MGGGGCCIGNCCIANCGLVEKIKSFFKGSSGSSSGGRTDSYDVKTADLESTVKVQYAMTEFREDTRERSEKLEKSIVRESRESLDDFISDLRKYNKIKYGNKRLDVNIDRILKENRKLEDDIHGYIVKRVSKRISLDDSECAEILKLDAGNEKTKALDKFYIKVLKEAVNELSNMLRDSMEKQCDNVEEHIQRRIYGIVDTCEIKATEFEKIKALKETDEEKIKQEQARLAYLVSLCEYGIVQLV